MTSFINGVGNIGGIVEGPLIGLISSYMGWEGVFIVMVGVSALGTLSTYRAYISDRIINSQLPK